MFPLPSARRSAELALCAALFLSGLIFMPHAYHIFWAPETFSIRLLAPLAIILLAFEVSPSTAPLHSRFLGAGAWILGALLLCWLLSTLFAFRKDLSLRECALWFASPLAFFACWNLSENQKNRNRILACILGAGLLQSLYGIIQSAGWEASLARIWGLHTFGYDALNWSDTFAGRASGFFGNPNFLGGHLAMLLPLSLALALEVSEQKTLKRIKAILWIVTALIATGLMLTQTRGAWIGAFVGVAHFLGICKKKSPGLLRAHSRSLIALALTGTLLLGLFLVSHRQSAVRLSQSFSDNSSLSERRTLMHCSFDLAAKHPLLGVGPGNFRIFFPTVEADGANRSSPNSRPLIFSEHAHNDFIQMAADSGFPAALLLVFLTAWVYIALWRGVRENAPGQGLILPAGILSSLIALQVHGLTNFPFLIAPTQMTAWCLAAVGLRVSLPSAPSSPESGRTRGILFKITLVLGLAVYFLSAFDAGRELMKDALWRMAAGEAGLGHDPAAQSWTSKALDLDPNEDRLWDLQASTLEHQNNVLGAADAWQRALSLNPHDTQAEEGLGRDDLMLGRYADGETLLETAVAETPNDASLWGSLGNILYMLGKYPQAITAYDSAFHLQLPTAQLLENKAAAQGNVRNYEGALATLDQARALDPRGIQIIINRAITHEKMGLHQAARQDLEDAHQLDASNSQVQKLMKIIR